MTVQIGTNTSALQPLIEMLRQAIHSSKPDGRLARRSISHDIFGFYWSEQPATRFSRNGWNPALLC